MAFLGTTNTLGVQETLQIAVFGVCVFSYPYVFLTCVSTAQLRFGFELLQLFRANYSLHVTCV
jgi:hypothetical protein